MSKSMRFVVFLPVLAIVVASMLLANMSGGGGGGAAVAAGDSLYNPPESSLAAVLSADSFDSPVSVNADGIVSYRIGTSGGNPVGAVFVVSVTGWEPGLTFLVGVDSGGVISGVEIIQQNETPSFWEMVEDARFYRGLVGNTVGMEFHAVSGATRTSQAIFDGANAAVDYFTRNILPTL